MTTDYQTYKASREWAVRREAVRKRANGKCERCLTADMQQVHHKTYAHIGEEPLEDLLGVCRPCHEYLSAKTDVDPLTLALAKTDIDVDPLIDGVRVYLAGPITGTRWRDDLLVGGLSSETEEGTHKNGLPAGDDRYKFEWPSVPRGLVYGFDFTGPWFEDVSGGHGYPPEDPHGWVATDRTRDCLESPSYVSIACKESIEASDVVFCWIPSGCSPYGSVWELGYATALDKIVVVFEQTGNNHDRWLAGANAQVWGYAETPVLAWERFVRAWKESDLPQQISWTRKCAIQRAKSRYQ